MHVALKSFAFSLFLLAPAACGNGTTTTTSGGGGSSSASTGTGPGTGGGGTSAAKACADSAKASCTKRDTCANGYFNKRTYGDEATCETRFAAACVTNLGSKGDAQSPDKIEACVAAFPTYTCTDLFDGNPPAACVPPAGTGAMGAACGVSAQCASTFCAVAQDAVCGTCQPLPAVGAACQAQAECGRDLACAKSVAAPSGKCAAWVASGGACLTSVSPCQAGLSCVGDDVAAMTMGTCKAAGATVGAPCDRSRKTIASCDANLGLVCIPAVAGSGVGTCQAIQLVGAGKPCGDIGSMPPTGFAACQAGGLCVKAAPTDPTGTCKAPAADGAACDTDASKGPPCLTGSRCVPTAPPGTAGTCKLPDAHKCM